MNTGKNEKRNVTQDVTPNVTQDVTPDVTQDVTPNVTQDVTPNVTQDVTPDVNQNISEIDALKEQIKALTEVVSKIQNPNVGGKDVSLEPKVTVRCLDGKIVYKSIFVKNGIENDIAGKPQPTQYRKYFYENPEGGEENYIETTPSDFIQKSEKIIVDVVGNINLPDGKQIIVRKQDGSEIAVSDGEINY